MIESFTQAVIRDLLKGELWQAEELPEVAREWRDAFSTREDSAVAYAVQLAKDFREQYGSIEGGSLIDDFIRLGFMRTNWRMVAEYILDRFAPDHCDVPAALSQLVPSSN